MILKSFNLKNINFENHKFFLFYGENDGAKNEEIENIIEKNSGREIIKYDEKEILQANDYFYNEIFSQSLFGDKKILIINRAGDKLTDVMITILEKNIIDTIIIINSSILEKKSKLRKLFEKEKELICIPFYKDTESTLISVTQKFFAEKKLNISRSSINLLINKCNGDRRILKNELKKIELFSMYKKKITNEEIIKLVNLIENFSISELVDNALAKNKTKTLNILNENNFNSEDSIIILRTFLLKLKRILKISVAYLKDKNLENALNTAKPPIFWKDKEIIKIQVSTWNSIQIRKLIYQISELELKIKKNQNNSMNLMTDFILDSVS